jgi:hypothetical protein
MTNSDNNFELTLVEYFNEGSEYDPFTVERTVKIDLKNFEYIKISHKNDGEPDGDGEFFIPCDVTQSQKLKDFLNIIPSNMKLTGQKFMIEINYIDPTEYHLVNWDTEKPIISFDYPDYQEMIDDITIDCQKRLRSIVME